MAMFGLALVAVLAFGAVSAGAASASGSPLWTVKGFYLGAGATKAFTAVSTSEVVLKDASISFSSPAGECSETGEIENGESGVEKNVVLSCKKFAIPGAPTCTVKSTGAAAGTVTTNSLKSRLVWLKEADPEEVGNLLEPTSGTSWATIEVSNCAFAGKYPIESMLLTEFSPLFDKNVVTSEIISPETPVLSYWTNGTVREKQTASQLKMKSAKATLTGKFALSLNSKEPFGIYSPVEEGPTEPRWKISNSTTGRSFLLGPEEELPFTASSAGTLHLSLSSILFELPKCTQTGKLVGSLNGQPGGEKEVTLRCEGVAAVGAPTCKINTPGQPPGTIVSGPLQSKLVRWDSSYVDVGEVLQTEGGGAFAEFVVTGCLGNQAPVEGKLIAEVSPEGETGTLTLPSTPLVKYWDRGISPKCEGALVDGFCERSISPLKRMGSPVDIWGSFTFSLNNKESALVAFG
jgi:hypothetical protein